jgi:hypothetical protein
MTRLPDYESNQRNNHFGFSCMKPSLGIFFMREVNFLILSFRSMSEFRFIFTHMNYEKYWYHVEKVRFQFRFFKIYLLVKM